METELVNTALWFFLGYKLVNVYRYLSALFYLDDGSNQLLLNTVSDQSIWCYSAEEFCLSSDLD